MLGRRKVKQSHQHQGQPGHKLRAASQREEEVADADVGEEANRLSLDILEYGRWLTNG